MAAASVTASNTRIAVGTIATDTGTWGNDGGGGGVADEPDIVYQGTTAQSRKVGTSVIGRSYTHGSGTDMDGTPASTAHWIAKVNATNSAALLTRTSPALHVKIGSGSGDYHTYYLYGSDNYPPRGGWQIIAIAPSVSGYASAVGDTGTPNNSSILYWSILGDFSATSKAENLVIDAIDVGLGLFVVGGDGVSADANFDDFVTHDEGTSTNRFGYVYTEGDVIFATGQLTIGQTSAGTSTVTEFTDSGRTVVWNNGLVTSGFHRLKIDIAQDGSVVSFTNCSFGSLGKENNDGDRGYTTTEDSRTVLEVTGTGSAASVTFTSCVIDNFGDMTLNAQTTLDTCVLTSPGQITAGGATFTDSDISGFTSSAAGTPCMIWNVNEDPNGELDGVTFTQGSANTHAIELGTSCPTTVTFTNVTWSGYGANDTTGAAIRLADRGTDTAWTINWSGGTAPTVDAVRAGDTYSIVNSVTVAVTVRENAGGTALSGARVLLEADTGGALPADASVSITRSGSTATVAHTAHGLSNGDKVVIRGANEGEYKGVKTISNVSTNAYDFTVSGTPTTPATGTITSTAVILDGTTNGSGLIQDTGFAFGSNQPVRGTARQGTTPPYYKTGTLGGTITASGFAQTVRLVLDQ